MGVGFAREIVDGFLFVSNRLALDFLNTRVTPGRGLFEALPDSEALERWLLAGEVITSPASKERLRSWRRSHQLDPLRHELIAFREKLLLAVQAVEDGSFVSKEFIDEVNMGLSVHPAISGLYWLGGRVIREVRFEPQQPGDLWIPVFDSVAHLLADPELHRMRRCESCAIHFLDTSKKGSRRWCSMKFCGNRFKVASYKRRQRHGS